MTVPFVVGAFLFPALLFLMSMVARLVMRAPVTSAADFVCLSVLFDGLLINNPAEILSHVKVGLAADAVASYTLLFLGISFGVWFFCLFVVEPRVAAYYLRNKGFPLFLLLGAWATSLSIVVVQIAFFTGRMVTWFS